MKTEKNKSFNYSNYSVRNPRNVWVVRLIAFFVFVLITDFSNNSRQPVPGGADRWARNWIAENGMDIPFERTGFGSPPKLIAELEAPTNSISDDPIHLKPNIESKSPTYLNISVSDGLVTEAEIELRSNKLEIIPISENFIDPQINFDAHISIAYAKRGDQFSDDYLPKQSKWLASGSIGLQYANAVVNEPSGTTYAQATQIDNLTSDNQGVTQNLNGNGFGAVFNVGLELGNRFELLSGVNFTQLSGNHTTYYDSEVQKEQTIFTSVNTNSGGNRTMETVESVVTYTNYFSDTLQSNFRVSSFEIPLVLKLKFGNRKLNYFVSSGVSSVLGTSYNGNFESNEIGSGNLNEVKYGLNTVNFLFGTGIQYRASNNISINLAPTFKYGIPISDNALFEGNSSTIGFLTGINYHF